ncbi:MAG: bifunctional [glutamate--ammonia ligase]-adenylyl-L-tyrosine phosphorylase/[glutamate--ammonia-ligase] adenylyltransferase [Gammaproteobacteria bacterium]|nr:MAG: bifunctional [glutamate--ammonia ligase]-adenylyl-L-tyrosine phosphorylase/[glutamate--ammonia-ligase] adenylyltransferase [Gammaproteobacteria bacterium]
MLSLKIEHLVSTLPAQLQEITKRQLQVLSEKSADQSEGLALSNSQLEATSKAFAMSKFIADYAATRTESFIELLNSGELEKSRESDDCQAALSSSLSAIDTEVLLMARLRIFRNREMVRIAWRDLLGIASIEETLRDLSNLADSCLVSALDFLYQKSCSLRGTPIDSAGNPMGLVVLGMGKLGAKELNYSSDIDLIYAYSEEGVFPGKREYSYHEFFTVVCRKLTKVINELTADGFVFRVDTRLRPFGDSGPLVMSFDAMESYYLSQAREWERYAMVKARVVAGDFVSGGLLMKILNPFIYRRYLDYSAFDSLRGLKKQINKENERKNRVNNVKLGPGGIREIEFIGQAFQLIRGGREKALQERGILKVLALLGESNCLPVAITMALQESYIYLRKVENRLQEYADKQTHSLPDDEVDKVRLAWSMDHQNWDSFRLELDAVQRQVHEVFSQVFEAPHTDNEIDDNPSYNAWLEDRESSIKGLSDLGYDEPASAVEQLERFRQSHAFRMAGSRAVEIFEQLMPLVLSAVGCCENSDITLQRVLALLETIARRTSYLALLLEHPMAISQLVKLSAASGWISQLITRTPILLDELLDPRNLYEPLSKEALEADVAIRLGRIEFTDTERAVEELLYFKNANVLRVATADVMEVIPLMVVSDYLTDIAEVVLEHVITHAWQVVGSRSGFPEGEVIDKVGGFAVIAYGKMGGLELGYSSDLDLVFLHSGKADQMTNGEKPISAELFYTRLGQRIMTILNSHGVGGRLYEIDMRLRPSGNSGLLVSNLDSFQRYQQNEAWTWEHQALVRARFVAGDLAVGEAFKAVRLAILQNKRDRKLLQQEVKEMREKMRESLASKDKSLFDLKQGVGGIADIEFIVQFLVLSGELSGHKSLGFTDNIRLLDGLEQVGCLSSDEAGLLADSYRAYRRRAHQLALQEKSAKVDASEFAEFREKVTMCWNRIIAA